MSFDFSKLSGKITEKYRYRKEFAAAMGMSNASLSNKLNGVSRWTPSQICDAQKLLDIADDEVCLYFFSRKLDI